MSEWFESAFDDFLAEHDAQDAPQAALGGMKTAFIAGAQAGIQFAQFAVAEATLQEQDDG